MPGLGQGGGFQLQIEDRAGLGLQALQEVTDTIVQKAKPSLDCPASSPLFRADTPQLYLEIDREPTPRRWACRSQDVFTTLNANMGSMYINEFNEFGRIWQVNIQAEGSFRTSPEDLKLLQVRNNSGQSVLLAAVTSGTLRHRTGLRHALQRPELLGHHRRQPARLQLRPGHFRDGKIVPGEPARRHGLRVDQYQLIRK